MGIVGNKAQNQHVSQSLYSDSTQAMDSLLVPDVYREIAQHITDANTWYAYTQCSTFMARVMELAPDFMALTVYRDMNPLMSCMQESYSCGDFIHFLQYCYSIQEIMLHQYYLFFRKHLDIVRLFIEKLSDAILPDEYDAAIIPIIESLREHVLYEYLEYRTILWMKLV